VKLTRRSFVKLSAVCGIGAAGLAHASHFALAAADEGESALTSDAPQRIRTACRACGKMECGVMVTTQGGRVVRIEGDETAFQSEGNCCTKSQSSLQASYHPDRLQFPMKRANPKDQDGGWIRISWDEAWEIIAQKFNEINEKYGGESNLTLTGTSRIWAHGSAAGIAMALGTTNIHCALQICKGPRLLAGALTNDMGLFWYEGVMRPKVYVQWGTACEYSNYDDSARTIISLASEADTHIVIDPRATPLGKEADYWLALRPGTDAALALAWTKIVYEQGLYDELFVKRWTNAPILVVEDMEPSGGFVPDALNGIMMTSHLLKESDIIENGSHRRFMAWDKLNNRLTYWDNNTQTWEGETWHKPTEGEWIPAADSRVADAFLPTPSPFNPDKDPALEGEFEVTLKDGRTVSARPVWTYYVEVFSKYTPEYTEAITEVAAQDIVDSCLAWATRIDPRFGNGGLQYQLATDQTGNCIQTCRILSLLSAITGNTDTPGGNRGQTRYPLIVQPGSAPLHMGQLPEGLTNFMINERHIDKEKYPLNSYFNFFSDATTVLDCANTGDPYPIKGGVMLTGNHMNQSNATYGWDALKQLDFFVAIDLWHAPSTEMADILLPSAHWLETDCVRVSQGASGAAGATCKCVEPPGEAQGDIDITIEFCKRFGLPFGYDPANNPFPSTEEVLDYCLKDNPGPKTWKEYAAEFQEKGWIDAKKHYPEVWGTYRRWEMGAMRQPGAFGTFPVDGKPGFFTPTGLTEIWSTAIESYMDASLIIPDYVEPYKSPVSTPELFEEYPFNMTTGSRIPVFFHSEHRQLPWCRELWPAPRVEINPTDAAELGIAQGDWVWIENENGKIRQVADLYYGIKKGVINCNHTWWYPEVSGPTRGWDLSAINILVYKDDGDPITGASTLRAIPAKIYKATPENSPFNNPVPCDPLDGTPVITSAEDPRLRKWMPVYEGRELT
jgi:anaerobic selenocysteine-containing dehydrogenase